MIEDNNKIWATPKILSDSPLRDTDEARFHFDEFAVTLARLIGFLEVRGLDLEIPHEQAIQILKAGISPQKSGTFRKGKPGDWREHFSEANKGRFKEIAGDLLVRLGYEDSDQW